jgi:hypothetical protein
MDASCFLMNVLHFNAVILNKRSLRSEGDSYQGIGFSRAVKISHADDAFRRWPLKLRCSFFATQ